jgi:hypothetical protein
MAQSDSDQQPIARTVGRRIAQPAGELPSAQTRSALDSFAARRTRVPKGVIRYRSHDEMQRDRERWQAEAMAEVERARA